MSHHSLLPPTQAGVLFCDLLLPILRALAASVRRDLKTFGALKTNNFFLFVALLIWGALVSGVEPVSSYPFLLRARRAPDVSRLQRSAG